MSESCNLIDEVALQRAEDAEHAHNKLIEELPGFAAPPLGSRGRKLDESQEAAPYSADESDSDRDSLARESSSSSHDSSDEGI
jgi:hypothetical protein